MEITNQDIQIYANKMTIYRILNTMDGKSYIGKCVNGLERVIQHSIDWRYPKRQYRARMLYRAINKYGIDNFRWNILYVSESIENLDLKEIEFIEIYKTSDRKCGYNLTIGGTGGNTRAKMTETEKIAHSKKLSESQKQSYVNDIERRTASSKRLRAIRNDPAKSLKNREMASRRIRQINQTNHPRKIAVLCVETGIVYESMKEAARALNVTNGAIQYAIKNGGKCKKLHFMKIK